MSNSEHVTADQPAHQRANTNIPRAVIHKQILNAAASDPDASLETIANGVSGATTALVEKVLREYGDPGSDGEDEDEVESDETKTDETNTETPAAETATSLLESEPESADSDSDSVSNTPDERSLESSSSDADERNLDGDATDEEGEHADEALQVPDPTTLTAKQLETLRAIADQPNATQAELATRFDVTGATISQRVNSIDGFDWSERRAFIETIFETEDVGPDSEETASSSAAPSSTSDTGSESGRSGNSETLDTNKQSERDSSSSLEHDETSSEGESASTRVCRELSEQLSALTAQVDRLEDQLADRSDARSSSSPFTDPNLAHKVAHACLRSDHISEAEELQILQEILGVDRDHPTEH